jgi:integrase
MGIGRKIYPQKRPQGVKMPKKIAPLTDTQIRNCKPGPGVSRLFDGDGLYLEVTPAGGKSWRFKYRHDGKERRFSFGTWPEVSLKQARQLRKDARAQVAAGVDPGESRKQDKAEAQAQDARATNTFEAVARRWIENQSRRWSQGHTDKALGRLEMHLFPYLGAKLVDEITPSDLLTVLQGLEAEGKHETVHRLRGLADNTFAFAIAAQLCNANPAAAIAKALAPAVTVHRAAIVEPKAVGKLMRDIWGYMHPLVRGALQLTALTAARPGEVRGMAWEEINPDSPHGPVWIIPAARTKLRRDHIIPLATQTQAILEGLRDLTGNRVLVFPNSRDGKRPISDMAMNMALRRAGYSGETHCAHGFRSTFSTLAREAGWAHHIIEAALAHVQGSSVAKAYDRAQYLPERRKLLEWWAEYLDGLRTGAKVTPINAGQKAS